MPFNISSTNPDRLNKLRELFSDTIIYGISSVAARFINYLLVPFHTGVFNPALYGVVNLVYVAIAFLNVIFTFGMESAYFRYAESRKDAPHIFKTLQLALLVFASLLTLVLWLAMPALLPHMNLSPEASGIYLMMLGILWFDTLSIVPFAELRLSRKAILFATLRVVHVLINVILNFYLILSLELGIEAVFLANLIATLLVTVGVWIFTAEFWKGNWSTRWFKASVRFGWPFVPAGIGYVINEMLDRHFLNNMNPVHAEQLYGNNITPEDLVGIYSACYKLAVFMLLLVQMYRMAWQPFFMRHSRDKDSPKTFGQAFIWFNVFSAIIFLVIALFKEQVVAINIPILNASLIDPEYWIGLEIVPFLLLAYWFHGWYINFSSGIFIKEKTSVLYKITLTGAGITIAANLLLIPFYGMTGSAVATLLSYGMMAITLGIYSKRVMHVPYRLPESFVLMGLLAVVVFAAPLFGEGILLQKILPLVLGVAGITGYVYLLAERE
ncbi:MAG: lipopolysaccharide biosynthesis protein [Balneolaceae bacterium]